MFPSYILPYQECFRRLVHPDTALTFISHPCVGRYVVPSAFSDAGLFVGVLVGSPLQAQSIVGQTSYERPFHVWDTSNQVYSPKRCTPPRFSVLQNAPAMMLTPVSDVAHSMGKTDEHRQPCCPMWLLLSLSFPQGDCVRRVSCCTAIWSESAPVKATISPLLLLLSLAAHPTGFHMHGYWRTHTPPGRNTVKIRPLSSNIVIVL
jgi:hypothetical protein